MTADYLAVPAADIGHLRFASSDVSYACGSHPGREAPRSARRLKRLFLAWLAAFCAAAAAADANTAGQAELERVAGIGPALSERILEARRAGAFKHWQDFIARVKGVRESSAGRLSDAGLTVDGTPFKARPAPP